MARRYEMANRNEAKLRTREAILDAAVELFTPAWYDEVTLGDVARAAGVSQQTVVNHFGSKVGLYTAGLAERFAPAVVETRGAARPGDLPSVVAAVVEDYERTGDGTVRVVALAERLPELAPVVAGGRRSHRQFVERVFAPQLAGRRGRPRERLTVLLATALDAATWHRLRRGEGLSREETADHLRTLVEALLAD